MGDVSELPEVLPAGPPVIPLPVRGVAWASFAMGAAYVVFAIVLIYQGFAIFSQLSQPVPDPAGNPGAAFAVVCLEILRPFLVLLGMLFVVVLVMFAVIVAGFGTLFVVAAVALLHGRRWARYATLVLAGIAAVLALSGPVIWIKGETKSTGVQVMMPPPGTQPGPGPANPGFQTVPQPRMTVENIIWHVAFCLVHGAYAAAAFAVLLHKQYVLAFH
ncbi:hypothetical protein AYO44_17420 [Planctomycetaceae bacterium SCGC AG-212-F19]|nr:hypothetical protein AYO44_17420 [Planctomycetaceae bacterium SCGC AG-212-F19]